MLININKFGGVVPKIKDPSLIPEGKSQEAVNCRFDRGGVEPLYHDTRVQDLYDIYSSMFRYYDGSDWVSFLWEGEVFAAAAPVANDSFRRVYYTEGGVLKVTDKDKYKEDGVEPYPNGYLLPCPPAPTGIIQPTIVDTSTPPSNALSPSMVCSASSTTSPYVASNVIDGNSATYWKTGTLSLVPTSPNVWWKVDLGAGNELALNYMKLSIKRNDVDSGPGSIYISGSNTGAFSGEEKAVFVVSGQKWNSPSAVEDKEYNWANYNAYRYYKIRISNFTPSPGIFPFNAGINEIEMMVKPPTPDPTLEETRAYVYTFVNSYGNEGPPSDPSDYLDCYDGNTVSLAGLDGSSDIVDATLYDITKKRIYRTNQTSSGTAQYQFVAEVDIDTDTYVDALENSALGEVLASLEWDSAPSGITGLISLPNGAMAGFVGNLLCISVPYYPHAWPLSYQYPVDNDIVGLGSFGNSILITTAGLPHIAVGSDPANMVVERMEMGLAGMSGRGLVQEGELILYPSPEGIMGVSTNSRDLITKESINGEEWVKKYNPSTIRGYYWNAKYVGFYIDTDGNGKGFMFDLRTLDFNDLDFYAYTGYYDKATGDLYLQVGMRLVVFGNNE